MRSHETLAMLGEFLTDTTTTPDTLARMRRCVHAYLSHKGRLSMDRCFNAPKPAQWLVERRHHYIVEALRLVEGNSSRAKALELRRVMVSMANSGCWRRWRAAGGLPLSATPLQRAAYAVLSCGKSPSAPFVPSERLIRGLAANTR